MKKLKLAILRNEIDDDHVLWISACAERADRIEWEVIDLTRGDWLERLSGMSYDGLLAAPNGWTTPFKILYDERLAILNEVLGYRIYPGLEEVEIYENKKYLSYWLAANKIPHPKTWVFYYEQEAMDFLKKAQFPIVAKANVGGSGNGVRILKSRASAQAYVNQTFSGKGAPRSVGPKWRKKGFLKRVIRKLMDREALQNKLNQYKHLRAEVQKDFVVFQEFIPHEFEWRTVRIGDSFFAHKKLMNGEKASGSLLKNYDNPPLELFDFVKEITDRKGFRSQSVDIFETADGRYLVNEMQCIFGQSDPYQMLVDGVPGRYRRIDDQWVFEAGDFNRHESFLLRLDNFIDILTHEKSLVTT
jgi:hypothetical protein